MELISQAEFARQQGVNRSYITKLVKNGVVKLVDGKVNPAQAVQAIEDNIDPAQHRPSKVKQSQPEIIPAGGQGGAVDFVTVRTMREAFRAKRAKLDFEERSGQLTDATKVKNDAYKAVVLSGMSYWPSLIGYVMYSQRKKMQPQSESCYLRKWN